MTAAMLRAIAPNAVIKGADQSLASSTTLQNDNALFVPCAANATYFFVCMLDYEGGTAGSSDIKWVWSVPTSSALRYHLIATAAAAVLATTTGTTQPGAATVTAGTNGAGVLRGATMLGSLITSTAGLLQLQWAQNASNATPTIVHGQSVLALWQVS
jgi:hypothetical protein